MIPRVQALLGKQAQFTLEWVSVYTFSCVRMDSFRHGRVLFVGDAAHCVSPFGARGANSGVQDAENLAWKLAFVLQGKAPESLLDSYASERQYAADENLLNSTRSTDFITPKSAVSRRFRDAVLGLAREHVFARRLVNSGRLSLPATLHDSPLSTRDSAPFQGAMQAGAPCTDAPVSMDTMPGWLLPHLGDQFVAMIFAPAAALPAVLLPALARLTDNGVPLRLLFVSGVATTAADRAVLATLGPDAVQVEDIEGLVAQRYDGQPHTCYLIRPDQHVCARWRGIDASALEHALQRATGHSHDTLSTAELDAA